MVNDLKGKIQKLMLQNRRTKDELQYTVPSPDSYPYQWLWDSCFNAIILTYLNPEDAKKELLSVVARQFENGLLPHMIYWNPTSKFKIHWGKVGTSSLTQPPIIADSVLKIYQKDKDIKFLKTIYPALKKFYSYLIFERDTRGHHLIGIINPDESGEDNSPRFDIPLNLPPAHPMTLNTRKRRQLVTKNLKCNFDARLCMKNFFWVKDVPFNVFAVKNLQTMSKLANILGLSEEVRFFRHQSQLIEDAMRKIMFEDGIFWSVCGPNYLKIRVKTWAIFAPMLARMYTKEEAKHLVNEHLVDKNEFWADYPVPTVSKDEPSFDPKGYWRGSTWISINWFIIQGLLNYGFKDIAREISEKSRYLVEKEGFREYYNPLTGEGFGARDFTWGGLVLDMQ